MKEMDVVKIISKNIHDIRIEKNISLQELADKSNLDVETIRQLGHGTCMGLGLEIYSQIAKGLEVGMSEITKGLNFVDD